MASRRAPRRLTLNTQGESISLRLKRLLAIDAAVRGVSGFAFIMNVKI
jgi:hypothetical protein